ncbi:hypothetical protein QOZ80_5AG0405030 [Eleusine coracana subsp. coracana]|nr:hypothetical protein QOZ80_5AG0405030 [Eleusine coracana subsp. coracana]
MATPAPNSSSNHLESWVFEQAVASVVLVTLNPKDPKRVRAAVNQVFPLPLSDTAKVKALKQEQRLKDCKDARCSTGFILEGAQEGQVYVMTCVHSLDHVFNAEHPITPEGINGLFDVSILCDHAECKYRTGKAQTRRYIPAIVVQVDYSKDLMLIQMETSQVQKKCKEAHRPLKLAQKFPGPLERTVMISWPPLRPRTACVGETSHPAREYFEIMLHAPEAHSMNLSEVNILGDKGSSGAPLLDGAIDVVGVYHSGAPGTLSYSYFVSFNDLRDRLITWGVRV